jgi:hypothetical protein
MKDCCVLDLEPCVSRIHIYRVLELGGGMGGALCIGIGIENLFGYVIDMIRE